MVEPISTADARFSSTVQEALGRLPDLILLHRPNCSGGRKYWYIIGSMEDLERALGLGSYR
ncbi:MAG TPA: hypothetical protein VFJ58_21205, partial [Armatimonadota bacterium]|nr:hypothetical protein [Armatimonadota bacterium]